MSRREEYEAYIHSVEWKLKRQDALAYARNRCQICNSKHDLHVHHRKYPRVLGEEPVHDLTVLCKSCHNLFHTKSKICRSDKKPKAAPIPKPSKPSKKKKRLSKEAKRYIQSLAGKPGHAELSKSNISEYARFLKLDK